MPVLLLEVGCEELPASACREAAIQLGALAEEHLHARPSDVYIGPRRLALLVPDLPERTPDEWVKGPPENLRERAAAGFAARHGVSVDQLVVREGFLGVEVPGRPIAEVLPERLAAIVRGLSFGKSMRWGSDLRFSRPVRWLCAKLDGETVEVPLDGVPSGGVSYAHRFAARGTVEIPSAEAYAETLRSYGVEPDRAVRLQAITAGLDRLGPWRDPAGVLDEVLYLVESPVALSGEFDERFLRLPPRVVETAMQSHQRYFPLGGTRFAFVANGGDPDVVRTGNERVLEGRLEDASFTFERDVALGIEALAQRLGAITFFTGAGSFADKTARLVALVRELGGDDHAVEAARLAKADQGSELVREFPDLEGHIGAEYARLAGKPEEVCVAIDEQYLPDAADAPLPSTPQGRVLGAADKLDTLAVSFSLGHRPTGSRDPFGLRRAAIGLCRLAIEGGVPVRIADPELRDFVEERLEGLLDLPVELVRAARGATGDHDLQFVADLARTLASLDAERLGRIREVYIRASRIVGDFADTDPVAADLFTEAAEGELQRALHTEPAMGTHSMYVDWTASLAPVLERFFDDVLVMDPDESVRAHRLRLLRDVRDRVRRYMGDLSQIPG